MTLPDIPRRLSRLRKCPSRNFRNEKDAQKRRKKKKKKEFPDFTGVYVSCLRNCPAKTLANIRPRTCPRLTDRDRDRQRKREEGKGRREARIERAREKEIEREVGGGSGKSADALARDAHSVCHNGSHARKRTS